MTAFVPAKSLEDIHTTVKTVFINEGYSIRNSENLSQKVLTSLVDELGGRQIYFPKGTSMKKGLLHNRIVSEFDGSNHDALAKKYKLSLAQIYNITRSKNNESRK